MNGALVCSDRGVEHLLDERLRLAHELLPDEIGHACAGELQFRRQREDRDQAGRQFVFANDFFEYGRHA
jgi:hypothetical protein